MDEDNSRYLISNPINSNQDPEALNENIILSNRDNRRN